MEYRGICAPLSIVFIRTPGQLPNLQGEISKQFWAEQGVRHGGVLSTDFYKVYNDGLLDRLTIAKTATRIGHVICVAPSCADDSVVAADCLEVLQSLLDIGVDYSKMERYILQPVKSVVIDKFNKLRRSREKSSSSWDLDGDNMPTVDKTMHVGICGSADTDETAVAENVEKARKTLYSLLSAGLHDENGFDPKTSLHLYQIYVLPVLLYGMEVVFPRPKFMEVLDKFNNYNIKHLLSLPVTAAYPAIYLSSGTLPIEAMIHHCVLIFFGNISRLSDSSIEKRLVERQLAVKSLDSHSWFVRLKKLCIRYGPTCLLCKTGAETLSHFLLHCAILEALESLFLRTLNTY